jgi:hypothetical protein
MSESTDREIDLLGLVPDTEMNPRPMDAATEIVRASMDQRDAVEAIAESMMETDDEGNPTNSVLIALERQAVAMERMAEIWAEALDLLKGVLKS